MRSEVNRLEEFMHKDAIDREVGYRGAENHVFVLQHVREDLYVRLREGGWEWTELIGLARRFTQKEILRFRFRPSDSRYLAIGVLIPLEDDDG